MTVTQININEFFRLKENDTTEIWKCRSNEELINCGWGLNTRRKREERRLRFEKTKVSGRRRLGSNSI